MEKCNRIFSYIIISSIQIDLVATGYLTIGSFFSVLHRVMVHSVSF